MDEESAPSQPETLVAEAQKPTSQNQQTVGIVTTLESFDYPAVEYAMRTDAELIKTAGIFPPGLVIERFASYFPPGTPFSYVLLRLNEISRIHPRYHLCGLKDSLQIADAIQTAKNLSITDRSILCSAPVNVRDSLQRAIILEFATRIGQQRTGPLLDIKQFRLELLDQEPTSDRGYLSGLETLHKGLVLYLWLSFRFPGVFTTRALAEHTKVLVENAIEHTLSQFSFTKKSRAALLEKRKQALLAQIKLQYQQNAEREGEEVQEGDIRGEEGTHEPKEDRDEINEEEDEDGEPPDVRDIITDKVSFQEDGSSLRDDYGEYPDPELESLKQHQRGHASKAP
jgi:ATP-dependent RNA helicase SUPV3L1/SUV3